ncbi:MAG: hypothetical protein DRG24_01885 [Epsilonproteobacteria bacterium]|nr:MAG: hypothetical protein DRG24_01885 [Campylobacterota bacterium]
MKNKLIPIESRCIPALLLIAIFTLFSYQNVGSLINLIQNSENSINKSGRQRMLSQKLVVLGTQYLNYVYDENLQEVIDLMRTSHSELMANVKNEELTEIYNVKGLDVLVLNYLKNFGTSLGLYMSKTIIEEHFGGELSAQETVKMALFLILR